MLSNADHETSFGDASVSFKQNIVTESALTLSDDLPFHSAPSSPSLPSFIDRNRGNGEATDAANVVFARPHTSPPEVLALSPSMRAFSDPFVIPFPSKMTGSSDRDGLSAFLNLAQDRHPVSQPNSPRLVGGKSDISSQHIIDERLRDLVQRNDNELDISESTIADDPKRHFDDELSDRDSWYHSLQSEEEFYHSPESHVDDTESRKAVEYTFAWSVATQKGYRYRDMNSRSKKLDIHPKMEDMHYPAFRESPNHVHEISGRAFQIFMLADGHGGHSCAEFAMKYLPQQVLSLVNSKDWNFRNVVEQDIFRTELQTIMLNMDDFYCQEKLEEYRKWLMDVTKRNFSPFDSNVRAERPSDDGCTLVMNLLYDGFLINVNTGDSRSLLLSKAGESEAWTPEFASSDHTPGHPERARQIHQNGGRFIMNGTTTSITEMLHGENGFESANTCDFLSRCRIGRPVGWRIDELNYPACTTLNLAGTMGDLFFKYNPPLISACPDVSFVKLDVSDRKHLLVMASDGLWDHMLHQDDEIQHAMVASYVNSMLLDSNLHMLDSDADEGGTTEPFQEKLQKLGLLAHGMADREMASCKSNLYAPNFLRYDDVTVFVVLVEGLGQQLS
eukprot:Partr_v1_DN27686_c0_g1_i4_m65158